MAAKDPSPAPPAGNFIRHIIEADLAAGRYAARRWSGQPGLSAQQAAGQIGLQRLYVDNSLHGRGVARLLMDASLAEAKEREYEVIWLGVWEHNERAYRFYQKFGFEKVGEHVFMLGADRQIDWILTRKL